MDSCPNRQSVVFLQRKLIPPWCDYTDARKWQKHRCEGPSSPPQCLRVSPGSVYLLHHSCVLGHGAVTLFFSETTLAWGLWDAKVPRHFTRLQSWELDAKGVCGHFPKLMAILEKWACRHLLWPLSGHLREVSVKKDRWPGISRGFWVQRIYWTVLGRAPQSFYSSGLYLGVLGSQKAFRILSKSILSGTQEL